MPAGADNEETEIRLTSAKDLTTERIRTLIHSGELVPGEKISIDDLTGRFGVSRTPVRDALWELSGEGLVTILPRVGVMVRRITAREVQEVYTIKGRLEPLLAQWAAEYGEPAKRQRFFDTVQQLVPLAETGNAETYVEALENRRRQLLDMAGSDVIRDALAVIDGRVRLLRYRNLSQPGRLIRSARQHVDVAQAVLDGDGQEAHHLMEYHMLDAEMRVRRLIEEHPEEFAEAEEERTNAPRRRGRGAAR